MSNIIKKSVQKPKSYPEAIFSTFLLIFEDFLPILEDLGVPGGELGEHFGCFFWSKQKSMF